MPEALSASVAILDGSDPARPANTESLRARVLDIYAEALARSLNERSAFETRAGAERQWLDRTGTIAE